MRSGVPGLRARSTQPEPRGDEGTVFRQAQATPGQPRRPLVVKPRCPTGPQAPRRSEGEPRRPWRHRSLRPGAGSPTRAPTRSGPYPRGTPARRLPTQLGTLSLRPHGQLPSLPRKGHLTVSKWLQRVQKPVDKYCMALLICGIVLPCWKKDTDVSGPAGDSPPALVQSWGVSGPGSRAAGRNP